MVACVHGAMGGASTERSDKRRSAVCMGQGQGGPMVSRAPSKGGCPFFQREGWHGMIKAGASHTPATVLGLGQCECHSTVDSQERNEEHRDLEVWSSG